MSWPWSELGLPGPSGLTEIRRAYAELLKDNHPEDDPEGFQRLHSAYQAACRYARQNRTRPPEPMPEPPPAEPPPVEEPEPEPEVSSELEAAFEQVYAKPEECEPVQPEEKPPETDWDYDRLFAEGEAEAQEARRRKLEELRRKNRDRYAAQEAEQRRHSSDEQEAWEAVMAATQALELLNSTGASVAEWQRFLDSAVFWNARSNLDFIFALEDFIEQHSELPVECRKAIFEAYGFEKGVSKPEYRRLYQLLGVSRQERQRIRKKHRPRRTAAQKAVRTFAVVWLAILIFGGVSSVIVGSVREIAARFFPSTPWEEQCLEWLKEDWGREFIRPFPDKSFRYSEEDDPDDSDYVKACVYAPADSPDEYFFAYDDGERDLEQGKPGYRCNYADRMLMTALSDFAEEWETDLEYDSANGGFDGNLGETPGAYLFQLPLTGAGDLITALGERLAGLQAEDWYRQEPPDFEVFLCYGDLNFYSNRSTHREFDADYARSVYENKLGPNLCRLIAEESGVAAEDLGKDSYVLIERGTVLIDGDTFFWVTALEKPPSKTELAHYLLSESGTALYAVPLEQFNGSLTQAGLHRGGMEMRIVESLGKHRMVTVWDRIRN